ncbi:MAG: 3-dehydroquinate synthase [Thermodesulfobacteriota bacterium]
MRELTVELAERSYPIKIDDGLLDRIGPEMAALGFTGPVAVVTNSTVAGLYGRRVTASLGDAGFRPLVITLQDGEEFKTLEVASTIYDRLIEERLERSSPVVALGGGVIGDTAGFVAATYLRGVPYVQVPTTLLAQVDSSVGGKTAVNHPGGKNLIGAFYQPRAVYIDPEALGTLDEREFRAGLAEVVKYGVIWDPAFFSFLESNSGTLLAPGPEITYAIERSCAIKAEVVGADETERGLRSILNFGHTFGHAIEALTGYGTYRHGEAVAMGMAMAARFSVMLGLTGREAALRIAAMLDSLGLPTAPPEIPAGPFIESMRMDKKVAGEKIRFVLLDGAIGGVVVREASEEELLRFLGRTGGEVSPG